MKKLVSLPVPPRGLGVVTKEEKERLLKVKK